MVDIYLVQAYTNLAFLPREVCATCSTINSPSSQSVV